ncbi:MAG: serine hydrolase [Ferruginibacter sp.]
MKKALQILQILAYVFLILSACKAPQKATTVQPTQPTSKTQNKSLLVKTSGTVTTATDEDAYFEKILKSNSALYRRMVADKNTSNIQIIFTEIKTTATKPIFTDHFFNKGNLKYFYPASAIKLPLVLLTLQKIREIGNAEITLNTTMITGSDRNGQAAVYNDPNTPNGKPTLGQYIKKALLVNDNDACNRLYEFLGQDYINTQLISFGYASAEILHRIGIELTTEENKHTNPIYFYDSAGKLIYTQKSAYATKKHNARKDFEGKGYFRNSKFVNEPMNMSEKNRISLIDLHRMMMSLHFKEAGKQFNIDETDRQFVLNLLAMLPSKSQYPYYAPEYDGYTKYLYFGGEIAVLPSSILSYNTSGVAYGQMTDVAYLYDKDNKRSFFVSATIYCNKDNILNDDKYDYETTGLPFFKNLGKALYQYVNQSK